MTTLDIQSHTRDLKTHADRVNELSGIIAETLEKLDTKDQTTDCTVTNYLWLKPDNNTSDNQRLAMLVESKGMIYQIVISQVFGLDYEIEIGKLLPRYVISPVYYYGVIQDLYDKKEEQFHAINIPSSQKRLIVIKGLSEKDSRVDGIKLAAEAFTQLISNPLFQERTTSKSGVIGAMGNSIIYGINVAISKSEEITTQINN